MEHVLVTSSRKVGRTQREANSIQLIIPTIWRTKMNKRMFLPRQQPMFDKISQKCRSSWDAFSQDIPKQQLIHNISPSHRTWRMPPKYGKLVPVPWKSKSKMADKERSVQEFSLFLSRTAREMEKVLCQLKWTKESLMKQVWIGAISGKATSKFTSIKLRKCVPHCEAYITGLTCLMFVFSLIKLKASSSKLVHCPINPSHRIPVSRLDKHLNVCRYTSKDIRPQARYFW